MGFSDERPAAELLAEPKESVDAGDPSLTANSESPFFNEPVRRFVGPDERSAFRSAIAQVRTRLGLDYPLVIDGQKLSTEDTIDSINPASCFELVGRVCVAGEREVERALQGAEAAFAHWSVRPVDERSALMRQVAAALRERRDEFAAWEILEAGKGWAEADADITEAIAFINYYADAAERLGKVRPQNVPGEDNLYRYLPKGVGLILPPWNFPMAILCGMLSAAVVSGNTVILKPSSLTPVVAAHFVDLLHEMGLPAGVVQFLPGPGEAVGEYLVRHPKTHFIAFTGSREVGLRILELAAKPSPEQHHVKRVIAEMGGKNAIIVDRDADLDDAVAGSIASAFGFQGQKCSAASRIIVVGSARYELFVRRLSEAAQSLRIGSPEESGSAMGPVISRRAQERIIKAIECGRGEARLVLAPDHPVHLEGYYVGPTIFADVTPDSTLAQDEIFGPVLSVLRATDFEQALEIANGTAYALTGGVYSRSPENLSLATERFQVGNLYLNRKITGAMVGRQPFGGYKESGVGSKTGGPDYLLQFMELRTITENTLRRGFAPLSKE